MSGIRSREKSSVNINIIFGLSIAAKQKFVRLNESTTISMLNIMENFIRKLMVKFIIFPFTLQFNPFSTGSYRLISRTCMYNLFISSNCIFKKAALGGKAENSKSIAPRKPATDRQDNGSPRQLISKPAQPQQALVNVKQSWNPAIDSAPVLRCAMNGKLAALARVLERLRSAGQAACAAAKKRL